jgi:hypothetical protein
MSNEGRTRFPNGIDTMLGCPCGDHTIHLHGIDAHIRNLDGRSRAADDRICKTLQGDVGVGVAGQDAHILRDGYVAGTPDLCGIGA